MEITAKNRKMFSELDEFLSLLTEEERVAIPEEERKFYKAEKDKEYVKKIDINKPLSEQNLMIETLSAIAVLNLKYWCKNEEEKNALKKKYYENEMKHQEMLREKYNPDNIFSNTVEKENETQIIKVEEKAEESFWKKIINKVKRIFGNKKKKP